MATEIVPFSSETITTTASETSLVPTPARWRVPRSLGRCGLSLSGMTQPAAATRPPRTMTAPSCRGEFLKKRLRSSCSDSCASTMVPVLKYSSSGVSRSKISRTPTRSRDMISQACTVAEMALCSVVAPDSDESRWKCSCAPTRSSARRSSGWNTMMSAIAPTSRILLSSQFNV